MGEKIAENETDRNESIKESKLYRVNRAGSVSEIVRRRRQVMGIKDRYEKRGAERGSKNGMRKEIAKLRVLERVQRD